MKQLLIGIMVGIIISLLFFSVMNVSKNRVTRFESLMNSYPDNKMFIRHGFNENFTVTRAISMYNNNIAVKMLVQEQIKYVCTGE
jgi:uncharacterized membrane protein YgaE (UPF0421/DUF939 family)